MSVGRFFLFSFSQKFNRSTNVAITHNKPCLSINDICLIIGQCNETTHINLDKLTTKLENLVKSKHYDTCLL